MISVASLFKIGAVVFGAGISDLVTNQTSLSATKIATAPIFKRGQNLPRKRTKRLCHDATNYIHNEECSRVYPFKRGRNIRSGWNRRRRYESAYAAPDVNSRRAFIAF